MKESARTRSANDLVRRDAAHVWHPYTQHGLADDPPLAVVRAEGSRLIVKDEADRGGERVLIDAISSWWTCLHGHGRRELIDAMQRQARELDHVLFAGATHEPAVALAEQLVAAAPQPADSPQAADVKKLTRVFYSDDGSTAVEVALKIAYQSWVHRGEPKRTLFLALDHGYHGDTFGAMAVGDPIPFFAPYAPLLFEVRRVAADDEALRSALNEARGRVAALIVEPLVQGAGGMRMHGADFLGAARRLCDEQAVPLIADEVMTGFGRTGELFACARAGIVPDLLCLAKGLTSGMVPLAATLATEELFAAFVSRDRRRFFPHGHSMTANPIGCAVALASLELARTDRVARKLDAIGERIAAQLAPLRSHPGVANLRRTGGIVAFDVVPPRQGRSADESGYFAALGPELRQEAIRRGVLLRPLGNVVYALPPASTTDAECDQIAATMAALADVTAASAP